MPKVYTYNAEFNPISFSDRIAPMRLYKEEYDKQQAAYEKMLEETDDLGVLKDIAMDADSYGVYKSFQDELNSIADEMSTKGLSTDIRNRLLKLKRRQANEINPLLERQKSRADLIKEQRKYLETHPNGMFDIDYDSVPLSKITSSSTYKPYDLGKDYASIADAIYSNIMSNNGTDTTDYNKIKSQYNYDNLSPLKQKQVDDVINLARSKATATYQIYKDKERLERERIKRLRTSSDSSNPVILGNVGLPDGTSIKRTINKSGQIIIKDINGKERIVPDTSDLSAKLEYYEGHYPIDTVKSGNITATIYADLKIEDGKVVLDDSGNPVVEKYYTTKKDGSKTVFVELDNYNPQNKDESRGNILSISRGINKPYLISNGQQSKPVIVTELKPFKNGTYNNMGDIGKLSLSEQVDILRSFGLVGLDAPKSSDIEKEFSQIFNYGFVIQISDDSNNGNKKIIHIVPKDAISENSSNKKKEAGNTTFGG